MSKNMFNVNNEKSEEESNPPVKEGEFYNVLIEGRGKSGDGVGRIHGYVIFVHNAVENETCKIVIDKVLPRFGFGSKVDDEEDREE